jgi:hypothetical protein
MDDPFRVCGVQSIGDLNCQVQQLVGFERPSGNAMLQRLPFAGGADIGLYIWATAGAV